MVAAARTMICVVFAAVSVACGVVLPPAEDIEATEPATKKPTTKGAPLPVIRARNRTPTAEDRDP